ncbi:hypothetical protein BU26DRAFT_20943 [Trematosphaeria pertusa]|uniref:Uncharacterized protein n=1 Tax=Trematosphaeria pertusa TaxID=390896 RepID=A0A6A6J1F9_9PLEO|nr:uncharacterized protein BU26DRAFT_20943 [Trematosphaeria pertusa]KAF2256388.1 hypothetical protein BU26DRAFT_20943 [Trematosphaeria pertusa]
MIFPELVYVWSSLSHFLMFKRSPSGMAAEFYPSASASKRFERCMSSNPIDIGEIPNHSLLCYIQTQNSMLTSIPLMCFRRSVDSFRNPIYSMTGLGPESHSTRLQQICSITTSPPDHSTNPLPFPRSKDPLPSRHAAPELASRPLVKRFISRHYYYCATSFHNLLPPLSFMPTRKKLK